MGDIITFFCRLWQYCFLFCGDYVGFCLPLHESPFHSLDLCKGKNEPD
ncbi:MAG: hypothetical protein ACR2P4_10150 [Gammaproteobacteria bacterium]